MRLERKIAIVTGGGTGIGEAIAKVFAREGATVAITGRRKNELERVVGAIERKGGQALALPGSVTNEQDVQEAVAATVRRFGRLDILVNNAGNLFHMAPLHETTDQIWDETFDVFMKGTFRFIRAAIPRMLQQGGGSILNISTIAGLKAMPGFEAHAYPRPRRASSCLPRRWRCTTRSGTSDATASVRPGFLPHPSQTC